MSSKKRGYEYFSKESIADWQNTYPPYSNQDIVGISLAEAKNFMNSVRDINNPKHQTNRLVFVSQLDSSEENVTKYFIDQNNSLFGKNLFPMQDFSYESRRLKPGALSTKNEAYEMQTLTDLLRVKWDAVGYAFDQEYVERFKRDYCLSLR